MKLAWWIIIMLLTIYAPIELTKIIIRDMFPVYPVGEFILEIALTWLTYLTALFIVWVKFEER